VTPKGQTRGPNTLRAQHLEKSWRWYLATIAVRQYGWLSWRQLGFLFLPRDAT